MEPAADPRRLFVSYTSADKAVATHIASSLRDAGHEVTIQASDFRPGNNFVISMQRGLTAADHVIAVLSSAYEQSEFGAAEWAAAFAADPLGTNRHLIGVRVEDYQPTGLLRTIVYVDLVDRTDQDAETLIAEAIESGRPITVPGPTQPHRAESAAIAGTSPRRAPHFTGRQAALAAISEGMADLGRVAITGLGGIGKTSLASEWLHLHHGDFDTIVWTSAADKQRGMEALGEAARQLGLVDDMAALDAAEAALRSHLWNGRRALLVLDNCPDAATALALAGTDTAQVLLTSRDDRGWSPTGFAQHRLARFDLHEGIEFLRATAPDAGEEADLVVDALGGLPLALAQAAAYIDRHALTFRGYLDRLAAYAPRMFEQPTGAADEHTVMSVWSLALDLLAQTDPVAMELLNVLAFVDPEDLPRSVLAAGADALGPQLAAAARDPFELDAAIGNLLAESLCRADGDGLSVHPVVQGILKNRLATGYGDETALSALRMLRLSVPENFERTTWSTWERLYSHAVTAAAEVDRRRLYSGDFVALVLGVARYFSDRGSPHYANYLYVQAMGYVTAHPAEGNMRDTLDVVEDLAHSFLHLRAADKAAPLFRTLMEVQEKNPSGPSHRVIVAHVGLASALTDTGEHQEALSVLASAAEKYENMSAPADVDESADWTSRHGVVGARLYGTWGRLSLRVNEPDEGRRHLTRALSLSEEAGELYDVALTHLHLGNSYRKGPDAHLANEHFERGVEIASRLPSGELRAELLVNQSGLAWEGGDPERALALVEEGLRVIATVPEGALSVTAAVLHIQRARLRSRLPGTSIGEVVAEAGMAFEIACGHLPVGHPHRQEIGTFLLWIAEGVDDDTIRSAVREHEPDLQAPPPT